MAGRALETPIQSHREQEDIPEIQGVLPLALDTENAGARP